MRSGVIYIIPFPNISFIDDKPATIVELEGALPLHLIV